MPNSISGNACCNKNVAMHVRYLVICEGCYTLCVQLVLQQNKAIKLAVGSEKEMLMWRGEEETLGKETFWRGNVGKIIRAYTTYLHRAVLIEEGNLTKRETKNF